MPGNSSVEVQPDDVLQRHERGCSAGHGGDEPRQQRRHLARGRSARFAGLRVGARMHGEVERRVRDVRERVRRVDGERRQDREDPVAEELAQAAAARRRSRSSHRTQVDALFAQLRDASRRWSSGACRSISRRRRRQICSSTCAGQSAPSAAGTAMPGGDAALAARPTRTMKNSSRFEREDRQELHPLQQRQARVLGQLQHARC